MKLFWGWRHNLIRLLTEENECMKKERLKWHKRNYWNPSFQMICRAWNLEYRWKCQPWKGADKTCSEIEETNMQMMEWGWIRRTMIQLMHNTVSLVVGSKNFCQHWWGRSAERHWWGVVIKPACSNGKARDQVKGKGATEENSHIMITPNRINL